METITKTHSLLSICTRCVHCANHAPCAVEATRLVSTINFLLLTNFMVPQVAHLFCNSTDVSINLTDEAFVRYYDNIYLQCNNQSSEFQFVYEMEETGFGVNGSMEEFYPDAELALKYFFPEKVVINNSNYYRMLSR
jgi:hypothetical protein